MQVQDSKGISYITSVNLFSYVYTLALKLELKFTISVLHLNVQFQETFKSLDSGISINFYISTLQEFNCILYVNDPGDISIYYGMVTIFLIVASVVSPMTYPLAILQDKSKDNRQLNLICIPYNLHAKWFIRK